MRSNWHPGQRVVSMASYREGAGGRPRWSRDGQKGEREGEGGRAGPTGRLLHETGVADAGREGGPE